MPRGGLQEGWGSRTVAPELRRVGGPDGLPRSQRLSMVDDQRSEQHRQIGQREREFVTGPPAAGGGAQAIQAVRDEERAGTKRRNEIQVVRHTEWDEEERDADQRYGIGDD